jgi:hypothetical protein
MHPETLATLQALNELYYDANRNLDLECKTLLSAPTISYAATTSHMYH